MYYMKPLHSSFQFFADAVYLVMQRVKFLEEKVKKLEARPLEEIPEPKPTSNYSSAHAFRNLKGGKGSSGGGGGGVKRGYVSASPTTPKKAKMIPRPVAPSSNYPFKPSVKILPRDPNMPSPIKIKDKEPDPPKVILSINQSEDTTKSEIKKETQDKEKEGEVKIAEAPAVVAEGAVGMDKKNDKEDESLPENMEIDKITNGKDVDGVAAEGAVNVDTEKPTSQAELPASQESVSTEILSGTVVADVEVKEEIADNLEELSDKQMAEDDTLPQLEDATADIPDEEMEDESGQEEGDMEVEQKPVVPLDDEGGDVSGSEASASSLASSSSKPRLSTRRRQAAMAASTSTTTAEKATEEEKPVMYTARGRRHTVPRRYAEFTGHDNVVSILKSQQRAEKTAAAGSSKSTRRQAVTPTKPQDTPPKIKKMVKSTKTPSPKKLPILTDSDGEGEPGTSKKKSGPSTAASERPPCVDALVDRVMTREVDSDGMVNTLRLRYD